MIRYISYDPFSPGKNEENTVKAGEDIFTGDKMQKKAKKQEVRKERQSRENGRQGYILCKILW